MRSQNREILNAWIYQLCELIDVSPEPLGEDGVTGIAFENGTEIYISAGDANNVANLSATVLKAPEAPGQLYQAMHRVLTCNTGFLGQFPCGIGLSPDGQFFVLHQLLELEGMTVEDFGEMLNCFSEVAAKAKAALETTFNREDAGMTPDSSHGKEMLW